METKQNICAEHHKTVRRAKSKAITDDYLEAIADLISTKGEARVVELAKQLGVTHVTVNRTITRLVELKLVTCEPYRSIFLTEKGRQMAIISKSKHNIVYNFLKSLGLPDRIAQQDAEGIEHFVSEKTLIALKKFARKKK